MIQKWLHKLGFKYKIIKKDVYIDKYKCLDIVENCQKILKIMKNLELYLIELKKMDF